MKNKKMFGKFFRWLLSDWKVWAGSVVLALIFGFGLLIGAEMAFGLVTLGHNESYNFSYDVYSIEQLNGTCPNIVQNQSSEEFFCPAIPEPDPSLICNSTSFDLELEPGETDVRNEGFCNVRAHCSFENTSRVGVCVIDKDLEPGQRYEKQDGVCDVVIDVAETVDQEELSCPDIETVTQIVPLRIQSTTSGDISIEAGNKTFRVPSSPELFSWESEVELQCPKNINIDTEGEREQLLQVCQEFTPFLVNDWIKPTLEACKNSQTDHLEDVQTCDAEKSGLRDTIASLEADVAECSSRLEASHATQEELRKERNDAENEAGNKGTLLWLLGIYSVVASIILVIVSILLWRKSYDGGFAGIIGGDV